MLTVSLLVEAVRARPVLTFWIAALAQALLWTLVPVLFYAAPPGDVPLVLAIGHEWLPGSSLGPPLAYWLAEIAFVATGHHVIGVYLLSQVCVVVTYWAVFSLGRAIVGTRHAAIAVLLMAGIAAFSVPSPEFGPSVLAMPLTALAILHAWRAIGEARPRAWLLLGLDLGLLLLTTYAGLILVLVIVAFTLASAEGRARLRQAEFWVGILIAVLVALPHLVWLDRPDTVSLSALSGLSGLMVAEGRLSAFLVLLLWLIAVHAVLAVLIVVADASGSATAAAPRFERASPPALARQFIYVFALAPGFIATVLAVLAARPTLAGGVAPHVVLSALAVVVAAGDIIELRRARFIGLAWAVALAAPAALTLMALVVLPVLAGSGVAVGEPAAAMGQFFTDNFRRRIGQPLPIVVGDARLAGLVALASPDRPRLVFDGPRERSPWISDADIRAQGAVVVWRSADTGGTPPAALRARFPDLVPEVPHAFTRAVQGRLPLMRIGWAVIRPAR
jgi:4-amino-4-deoxy-L-arabinose transferase-like glycosyltransferase